MRRLPCRFGTHPVEKAAIGHRWPYMSSQCPRSNRPPNTLRFRTARRRVRRAATTSTHQLLGCGPEALGAAAPPTPIPSAAKPARFGYQGSARAPDSLPRPKKTSFRRTLIETIRVNEPWSVSVPAVLTRSRCPCVAALRATARPLRKRTSRAPCRVPHVMKPQK
jgi:hypothetical protein